MENVTDSTVPLTPAENRHMDEIGLAAALELAEIKAAHRDTQFRSAIRALALDARSAADATRPDALAREAA